MKRIALLPVVLLAVACSSGTNKPKAPPPSTVYPTPTPMPMSRINPNVIEETETGYIERLPKSDYVQVDERHIRARISPIPSNFSSRMTTTTT